MIIGRCRWKSYLASLIGWGVVEVDFVPDGVDDSWNSLRVVFCAWW